MEVTREVVVPGPVEEVWEALTDPEQLEEWFANEVELELAPGGAGVFRWADGETRVATVEEVDDGRRFAFRWADEDGDGESRVELVLEQDEGGTRVVVTETELSLRATAGWAAALELRAFLVASVA